MTDQRWKKNKIDQPGPADYELSPMYQDTILKGTFNATLNNPLVYKKQKDGSESRLSNNIHHGSNVKYGLEHVPEQHALKIS